MASSSGETFQVRQRSTREHIIDATSDAPQLPTPSTSRLHAAHGDQPFEIDDFTSDATNKDDTVLYLAYGSNLSIEKFRKSRGIKPLAQVNVHVPSLRLTFDLPGIPYFEPCFANTALENRESSEPDGAGSLQEDEKRALLNGGALRSSDYRKDRWHKGLIGVVYEVTRADYAHIIATEGGGASYLDIVVDCHPLTDSDPNAPVPEIPTSPPFKAHTLYAPALPNGSKPSKKGGRIQRPIYGYAQSSARYLKLITDGAAELRLPQEYQDYLLSLRPFTITTIRQRLGSFIFVGIWAPVVLSMLGLMKLVSDKDGRAPKWAGKIVSMVFSGVWLSYDDFFKSLFGEGERTIGDDGSDGRPNGLAHRIRSRSRRFSTIEPTIDLEKAAAMQGTSS